MLGRWDEAALTVKAPVVKPVDVLRDVDLEVVDGLLGALVPDHLGLEQRVEGLVKGVVRAVTEKESGGIEATRTPTDEVQDTDQTIGLFGHGI